jgi:hypothetical protein
VQAKYDALTAAQKTIADNLKAQGVETSAAIAQAAATTQAQIAGVSADVQAKYDTLTAAQKAEVAARVQQGSDLTTAINNAAAATATQIAGVSADLQTKYNALTAAQKATADALIKQGADTATAIADATKGLATTADLQTKYNALTAGQKTIADNLTAQGIATADAIAQAAKATAAGFTGINQTLADQQAAAAKQRADDLAAAAAQRAQDEAAADARAEELRQQGIKAANVATRRAQIGQATTQTGNVLSDLKQKAAAMQNAPTIAPELVQSSAGFDFSQPLDVGLFGGYAQRQKTNQLEPSTAKIATGGYLDDLLNAIR